MSEYVIEMLNITKEFPGIKANDNITLQLKKGEVHALLGENGAGKSTLMSVLFGLYQPEQGTIKKDGKVVEIKNPNDANALNIGMVHQHFKLVDVFSVLDNIILGVEPNTALGQADIIPYRNHGTMEAQFQLCYKGLIDLAYRSGDVSIIQAQIVYENDEFDYELGLDPKLKHVPATKERGNAIAYYAIFKTKDGGYGFEVMSVDDVRQHAQRYSKSYGNSPWQTNFDEMAKKTVLKRVLKYAPLKSDFVRGITQDETVKTKIDEDMYSVPDETIYADYVVDDETGEVKAEEEGKLPWEDK